MKTHELTIRFDSPAFLGGADQTGTWRTPPFKAQLRHWWRMVMFAQYGFKLSMAELLAKESDLFGGIGTNSQGNANKSLIRLRLDRWRAGTMSEWKTAVARIPLDSDSFVSGDRYMAYGPVSQKGSLTHAPAIAPGEAAVLSIAYKDEHASVAKELNQTLELMSYFGSVGGRSRNGWGSFQLSTGDEVLNTPNGPLRYWIDCLKEDWPHAIGRDDQGPLIWQTKTTCATWDRAMALLADTRLRLRETFPFETSGKAGDVGDRHWLAYPVTKHAVGKWKQLRLPNTLRMKIRRNADGSFTGMVFHVPHKPPAGFGPLGDLERIWESAHRFLDSNSNLARLKDLAK